MPTQLHVTGAALHPATRNRIMGRGLRDMMGVVTGHGVVVVRDQFVVFKHPTGYYESRTVADVSSEPFKVWDSNVVYGPWLEGTGRRNQTTRFKGYHSFRKATQTIQRDVPRVVAPVLARVVAQLNGGTS
jgi:hypothetical protein